MPFLRPLLMGGANVAVADEASAISYNPAALASIRHYSVEAFTLQIIGNEPVVEAALDPEKSGKRFNDIDETSFRDLIGVPVHTNATVRMPTIVLPKSGTAFGFGIDFLADFEVLDNPIGPNLAIEIFADAVIFTTTATRINEQLDIGFTPKVITRAGVDKTLTFGELFASSTTLNLDNDPAFKDLSDGVTFTALGLDAGFIYRLEMWEGWHPRIGFAALNIGGVNMGEKFRGIEFGKRPVPGDPPQAGELPQINSVGFAVSPSFSGLRLTLALDFVDVTATALPGDDIALRSRLGLEAALGVKKDGTAMASLLAGFNATHLSLGALFRIAFFEVGLGIYTVERGAKPGDQPDDRGVFIFGIRF